MQYLKRGMASDAKAAANRQVRDIVEAALADIEARGDVAVREMSEALRGLQTRARASRPGT